MKLFGLHLYRQALHETIRASLGLPNFCLTFFQTCISHHGCEKSQIYGKLQFLEDLLASQNIDSSYFYSYVTKQCSIFNLSFQIAIHTSNNCNNVVPPV